MFPKQNKKDHHPHQSYFSQHKKKISQKGFRSCYGWEWSDVPEFRSSSLTLCNKTINFSLLTLMLAAADSSSHSLLQTRLTNPHVREVVFFSSRVFGKKEKCFLSHSPLRSNGQRCLVVWFRSTHRQWMLHLSHSSPLDLLFMLSFFFSKANYFSLKCWWLLKRFLCHYPGWSLSSWSQLVNLWAESIKVD